MRCFLHFPFGPVLLCILYPYLKWYGYPGVYEISEAHRVAILVALTVLVFLALLTWLLKSWQKAGVIGLLVSALVMLDLDLYVLAISIPAILLMTTILEHGINYTRVVIVGNILSLASLALLYPVWLTATQQIQIFETASIQFSSTTLTQKPSIIHIVLDGYGAPDTLSQIYGHDNSRFLSSLEDRGFQIMPEVITPFNQTLFVMASIFSGGYANTPDGSKNTRSYYSDLGNTVRNGGVISAFRNAGYRFFYTESGYAYLDLMNAQRLTAKHSVTGFETYLAGRFTNLYYQRRAREIRAGLSPENMAKLQPPFFYYQHIIAPHPPFVLSADGQDLQGLYSALNDGSHYIQGSEKLRQHYINGYREQAQFVENSLIEQLDVLPQGIPIIVLIHGDHGPGAFLNQDSAEHTCLPERMTTFFAVYSNMPEIQELFAEQGKTGFNLVNIYRTIFSGISDEIIEPLPSESRFIQWNNLTDPTQLSINDLEQGCVLN